MRKKNEKHINMFTSIINAYYLKSERYILMAYTVNDNKKEIFPFSMFGFFKTMAKKDKV